MKHQLLVDSTKLAAEARERDPKVANYFFGEFSANVFGRNRRFAFQAGSYSQGNALAILLVGYDDEFEAFMPFTDVTKNLPGVTLEADCIVVKAADENECIRAPLLETAMFEDTGQRVTSGFSSLEVWRLTPAFAQAFHLAQ